jgi:oxygen-independent coproporphyrinogen-3 oxidase
METSYNTPDLLRKYDVPTPRYTSYPTVPYWQVDTFSYDQWTQAVQRAFHESNEDKGISLYIHLPFCEHLCTYCACNTRITQNHKVEIPYIQAILKEWEHYKKLFGAKPVIRELHLGGGTPTFFSAENLHWLISYLLEDAEIHRDREFSFEGHPNNTTWEQLHSLFNLGFTRVSFGVQDLNLKVQQAIHRVQPFENLERVTHYAREIGYESLSYDLVYGLPFQTPSTVAETVLKIAGLKPDRLSFYSYAHVPWIKPGQRGYEDADLPTDVLKRLLYETGRDILKEQGYEDIGMDHFSLPHDSLYKAHQSGKLHRNFMGYTTTQTDLLIGLGASSISDARYAYAQNEKKVETYTNLIKDNGTATFKGHLLTEEDLIVKQCIRQLSCQNKLDGILLDRITTPRIERDLQVMENEGLLYRNDSGIIITENGLPFIRNICQVFDLRMHNGDTGQQIFSKAI